MADIAEAFEQHLRSLSDDEWTELEGRVRDRKAPGGEAATPTGPNSAAGRAEAQRRYPNGERSHGIS